MKEKESEITRIVREAVISAAKNGEDLTKKGFEITHDAVIMALGKGKVTNKQLTQITCEITTGLIYGARDSEVTVTDLLKYSFKGITEGIKKIEQEIE